MPGPRRGRASAPGKVILFGEHAIVHGQPSLSLALDRRLRVSLEEADTATVNGHTMDSRRHAYLVEGLKLHWKGGPVRLRTESELPSASGLGSSAALSVALVGAIQAASMGKLDAGSAARQAFEVELGTQGAASPNDTTVATAGGAVYLAPARENVGQVLWSVSRGDRTWVAHRVPMQPPPLIVANTGPRAKTGDLVARVKSNLQRDPALAQTLQEIGDVSREGVRALEAKDWVRMGALMDRNEACLARLGVETPDLARILGAARRAPGTLGAKLTGAGGGGCVLVLSENATAAKAALTKAGATVLPVAIGQRGLEAEP